MDLIPETAVIGDAADIATLTGQLGYPATTGVMQHRLLGLLDHPENVVFVVRNEGKVVGWIQAVYCQRIESGRFVEITGLVVGENYRKGGIGQLLIQQVIAWSRLKDCSAIRVRSNIVRRETHSFYLRIGFEEIKEQKVFGMQLS